MHMQLGQQVCNTQWEGLEGVCVCGSKAPSRGIYRMSPKELDALKLWVADMIKKGYIVPSKLPFGAPVMFVEKQDGSLRLVVDYRATNAVTVKNTAPLPRIDALLDKMNGKQYFHPWTCSHVIIR